MVHILDTGIAQAQLNMNLDAQFLAELDPSGVPLLHFYDWQGPSLTIGYFIEPKDYFKPEGLKTHQINIGKRPTGGGVLFHIWDFAFSFLMPAHHPAFSFETLENYRFVNQIVLLAVQEVFSFSHSPALILERSVCQGSQVPQFCMARPTEYDILYEGKKIAGAAQRRKKQGYLHQGTISLAFPQKEVLEDVLLCQDSVLEAMFRYTFAPLGENASKEALIELRSLIQKTLSVKFMEKLSSYSYTPYQCRN